MSLNVTFDGVVKLGAEEVPFHFSNNKLTIFCGRRIVVVPEEISDLIGQKAGMMSGNYVYFYLGATHIGRIKGPNPGEYSCMGNVIFDPEYYIDGYESSTSYTEMRFHFPELDSFLPSTASTQLLAGTSAIVFSRQPVIVCKFEFMYRKKRVELTLQHYSCVSYSNVAQANTVAELQLSFDETTDMEFITGLYQLTYGFFAFLCNRTNLSLEGCELCGNRVVMHGDESKTHISKQQFILLDRHKADYEDKQQIARTIPYSSVKECLEPLFRLFVDDVVSLQSIHPSIKARNLIDLSQSLRITSAFEYYVRTFLPPMSSQETKDAYEDIKHIIQDYADASSGKKKHVAKSLIKKLSPELSLEEKIKKVYCGYERWPAASSILNQMFGEDISELAKVANMWRNELAHEKRSYEPDCKVITSVRLIEHLNYLIILRIAGYSDTMIRDILERILTR